MNWKAIGIETGKTYATGTKAECIRMINERVSNNDRECTRSDVIIRHEEAIRVMPEWQHIETAEDIEKELELLREKFRQAAIVEKTQAATSQTERERKRNAAYKAKRIFQAKKREAQQEARRNEKRIEKECEKAERMELAEQLKAKRKERAERAKEKLLRTPRIVSDNPTSIKWTEEEESFLLENHEMDMYDLLELMRSYRPKLTINALTTRLHIVRKKNGLKPERNYTHWSPEMDAYILENYGTIGSCDMAIVFGVSRTALYQRVIKLRREGHKLEVVK